MPTPILSGTPAPANGSTTIPGGSTTGTRTTGGPKTNIPVTRNPSAGGGSTTGPLGPTPPSIQSLQTANPGAQTYSSSSANGTTVDPLTNASASDENTGLLGQAQAATLNPNAVAKANAGADTNLASISNGQMNPNDSTNSASQLDAITAQNSPYIQLAEQQGLLTAASRGLENSSIGAGAAEAAAVQAAAPLATQNAGEAAQGKLQSQNLNTQTSEQNANSANTASLQNSQLSTQTSEQNAAAKNAALAQNSQLDTQASEFNSSQDAAAKELNAQIGAQTNQFNASQNQSAAATNAAAKNQMTSQTMSLNEDINKQYLSGTQAMDLASIQGQFNQLIQSNSAAAGLYNSYFQSISAVMANKDIDPTRVAESIAAQQAMLESGLSVINQINGMNLDVTQPNESVGGGFGAPGSSTNNTTGLGGLGGRPHG